MSQEKNTQPYYRYPGTAPRQKKSGIGCWLVGIVTLFVAAGLVIAALFLPPFNLGDRLSEQQYAMLDSTNNGTQTGDANLRIIVDPDDPGDSFGVSLDRVAMNTFLNDTTTAEWVPAANAAVPPYLALQSPVYSIATTGDSPTTTTLEFALPNNTIPDVLDIYGWYVVSGEWRFVPAQLNTAGSFTARVATLPDAVALFQASPVEPAVMTTLDFGQTLNDDLAQLVTIVSPTGMQPSLPNTPQRTLVGNPAPGINPAAAYRIMPVIRNFADPRATDPDTVIAIIGNRELRAEHAQQLTAFAGAGGYHGIMIDYRDLPDDQRDMYSAFIRELAANLQAAGLELGVIVPPAQIVDGRWETGAYDWRTLGQVVDYLEVDFDLNPTAFAPGEDQLVEAMMRWAVGEVSRYKLIAGLSALSIRQIGDQFTSIGYDAALAPLGDVQVAVDDSTTPGTELTITLDGYDAIPGVDTTIQAPFVEYLTEDGTVASRMWLATAEALRFRMDALEPFGIGGVAFNDLLDAGVAEGIDEAIQAYKLQLPGQVASNQLQLNWRIESTDGVVQEFVTDFTGELVVTLDAPDGNYAVNVEVIGGEATSRRSGAAVALFAPTATPTPMPTSTATPQPTVTPTLETIIPTDSPDPVIREAQQQQFVPAPAVAPPSGSIAGGFEYGGHVAGINGQAIDAMRGAGMTWLKVQVRYTVGRGTERAQEYISQAREAGFRILLGVVGEPSEVAAGGQAYIDAYANFVGELAVFGPDAIEVWNEPNIDREWPGGQINGANYTALLAASYNAIKSINPGVMVISAAPAPTGAEAAFPGRVVNDDTFLRQMVNAGAMNYADCVGMHYNEGTVGPTQVSGDFRGDFHTRYLPSMIDLYNSITGGVRPICITELGYLSPQGLPSLSANWAWAQNTTVSQQAAWLAGAAAYSSQRNVRLMIVWNVNFSYYSANDPMAGYAIIRPDGSCPACGTLARAR